MPVRGDTRYHVIRRLELTRRRLLRWNRIEVGNIFKRLEVIEVSISKLQEWEDQEGGLAKVELVDLRGLLSTHHSLLQ